MYRKINYSQFFQLFTVLLPLFVIACHNNLEEKLALIEQRVLDETVFGRQIRDYTQSKNTRYIVDKTLSYPARYSTAKDSIYYNPKFNPTQKRWKSELLQGRPVGTILNFHEELHRTQVAFSERGSFFRFFRENGHIEENILPNDRVQYDFRIELQEGDEGKVLQFAGSLVGYPILNLQKAGEIVKQKIDEMNRPFPEKLLLDEIQAHIGSDIITAEGVYPQLYETKGKGYDKLPKMGFSDFEHLCDLIIQLYGFYDGNHDEVCKVVGKSKSIEDFQKKVRSIFSGISSEELNRKADDWLRLKEEWARETMRIAKEVLN